MTGECVIVSAASHERVLKNSANQVQVGAANHERGPIGDEQHTLVETKKAVHKGFWDLAMSSQMSLIKDHPRITKSTSDSSSSSSSSASESLRGLTGLDRWICASVGPVVRLARFWRSGLTHERVSRLNSHGVSDASNEATKNHAESYFSRRENRLSARKKAEEEIARNDYKKARDATYDFVFFHVLQMYEKALATNQRLKSRLETSKQELVVIQEQLQRAQDSRSLRKKISDMEDQVKAKVELHTENQRLKDENGALIRVITKLSK
nr:uncharacterized protein LOC133604920 [Nerophis lumbriciformis]